MCTWWFWWHGHRLEEESERQEGCGKSVTNRDTNFSFFFSFFFFNSFFLFWLYISSLLYNSFVNLFFYYSVCHVFAVLA